MKRLWILLLLFVTSVAHAGGLEFRDPDATSARGGSAASALGRVTFTSDPGLEDAAYRLGPTAERALGRIEADLEGLPRVEHVQVKLVRSSARLAEVAPPGHSAPAWASGVAWPETGIVAVAARGPDGSLVDMQSTLAHELAHMALERALGANRVPRWLHEGFAYQHSSSFEWERAETLGAALFRRDLMRIGALERAFPARHDGVSLAYAESYDFVGFLANRGRWPDLADDGDRWPFRRFLVEIGLGKSVDAAADAAFGRTIAQLDGEWVESLETRFMWYPLAALGGMFWVLLALLAVLGWRRRRRQTRARLAQMAIEEAHAEAAARERAEEVVERLRAEAEAARQRAAAAAVGAGGAGDPPAWN